MEHPERYEAWYRTPRGAWIAEREFRLIRLLLGSDATGSLLDVGCGTGHFTRRFREAGFAVTGLDMDPNALAFAASHSPGAALAQGSALALPFADRAFDHVIAITSLCFIKPPQQALGEMLRVGRRHVVLGLLNRHSLLHRTKRQQGSYRDARWDAASDVTAWFRALPSDVTEGWRITARQSALFLPDPYPQGRWIEPLVSSRLPWGGFLAVRFTRMANGD